MSNVILDYPCRNKLHLTEDERLTLLLFIRQFEENFLVSTVLNDRQHDYQTIQNIALYLENLNN